MPAEPRLPAVAAVPCTACGEEMVIQASVVLVPGSGLRMRAVIVQECGCGRRENGEAKPA